MNDYDRFLATKTFRFESCGFDAQDLNPALFPFQRDIVRLALRKGRFCLFEDCGLGKTIQQLEWAGQVAKYTDKPVLIFAPLAAANQTAEDEAPKFGIPVKFVDTQADVEPGINITNYEKMAHFSPDGFAGIVLDESSILKAFDGKTRKALTEFAAKIPFRLACTATPAPNDYMELGNHAEFLGVMTLPEMLATFFVHDGGNTSKWRLKRHAVKDFWMFICSFSVAVRKPSDLGYEDGRFVIPPLRMHQITVPTDLAEEGRLFPDDARTLTERRNARRSSFVARVKAAAELVNPRDEQWVIWCNLNDEGEALTDSILRSVQVTGSDSDDHKRTSAIGFSRGEIMRLVSKPLIFGWGMNWQKCHKIVFVGLSDSYEQLYQAIRRCWRFGQTEPVDCYIVASETEGAVVRNIERKDQQHKQMMEGMVEAMKEETLREVHGEYNPELQIERCAESGDNWLMVLNDCVTETGNLDSDLIDYSIFSPPFASLYTYTRAAADMGNCLNHAKFYDHFRFLVAELFRVLKPGRLLSFHCMNLPMTKERDGEIGIWDFRGELIRIFTTFGFIYHSEVVIWKDPVTAMQRTKALGLLYKQLRKDSCMSRQGIPDYLVTMRKPGTNQDPVTKTHGGFPVDRWQRYASPVWMDINPSKTLQKESAREHEDERHICPLQLEVIERAIELWTNPGDCVFSPFAGIGSEGFVSIQKGRKFIGVELKESYFKQAVANLKIARQTQEGLFQTVEASGE